jgi:hypothetical protein
MRQSVINHIGIVADASASMQRHAAGLIKATDGLVSYLAQRSKAMDQETRLTFYTFNHTTECVFYDMDVLRMPSIADHYHPRGRTALRDATGRAINDMKMTAILYGDHAFLLYALTDGWENESHLVSAPQLTAQITGLPDNWTIAGLGPNATSLYELKGVGFPAGNVERWDTDSATGIEDAGESVLRSAGNFMTGRAAGVRSSRTLFSTDATVLNPSTVRAAGLGRLAPSSYSVIDVFGNTRPDVRPFVERYGFTYVVGNAYYQLTKRETIQAGKQILVREKSTGNVYGGQEARDLLGLGPATVQVTPSSNPLYEVYVQSKSVNRRLVPGTKLIYVK